MEWRKRKQILPCFIVTLQTSDEVYILLRRKTTIMKKKWNDHDRNVQLPNSFVLKMSSYLSDKAQDRYWSSMKRTRDVWHVHETNKKRTFNALHTSLYIHTRRRRRMNTSIYFGKCHCRDAHQNKKKISYIWIIENRCVCVYLIKAIDCLMMMFVTLSRGVLWSINQIREWRWRKQIREKFPIDIECHWWELNRFLFISILTNRRKIIFSLCSLSPCLLFLFPANDELVTREEKILFISVTIWLTCRQIGFFLLAIIMTFFLLLLLVLCQVNLSDKNIFAFQTSKICWELCIRANDKKNLPSKIDQHLYDWSISFNEKFDWFIDHKFQWTSIMT